MSITWKRDKRRGDHVGSLDGRPIARIVRLSASAWRWSYRGPHQAVATVDEARLLKHAKEAVEGLHDSKQRHCKADDPAGGTRANSPAGQRSGKAAAETAPGGGGGCKRHGPPISPSTDREPGSDAVRVEGPHPLAAPRGMVSGESPEQRLFESRHETPRGAAPFSQLSLLGGADA